MNTPTTEKVIQQLSAIGRELDERQVQLNGEWDWARDEDGELLRDEEFGQPYLVQTQIGVRDRVLHAERDYRMAFAEAYLTATGSVEERKQQAAQQVDKQWFHLECMRQQMESLKDVMRVLRDRLEIGRSLNSAVKAEWHASGAYQP